MAEPSFQQKKAWGQGRNIEPASPKPTWIQSLWASTPGRLVQGSLMNASGEEAFYDLRPFPRPVAVDRGATGLMADVAYSQPVQATLRNVMSGDRSPVMGIIGDYLRDEIGLRSAARGLLSGPR